MRSAPPPCGRPGSQSAKVTIVVAWELCWYRYEIDPEDETRGAWLAAEGMELEELAEEDRIANAVVDERGALSSLVGGLSAVARSRALPDARPIVSSRIEHTMIYSVVPRPLADELYPKLVEHYKRQRERDRDRRPPQGRQARSGRFGSIDGNPARRQRIVRDRRRARVPGDLPALAQP